MFSKIIPEYSAYERELLAIEPSWADSQRGYRTGFRCLKDQHGSVTLKCRSLQQVAAEFSRLKAEFDNGNKSAIIFAVQLAASENVPMPYWVGDSFGAGISKVHQGESNLHTVFGFDRLYPTTAKRARKSLIDRETKVKLYVSVCESIAKGMNKTAAIKEAIKGLPVQFRKAFDWYSEIDKRQKAASAAWHVGTKVHKS